MTDHHTSSLLIRNMCQIRKGVWDMCEQSKSRVTGTSKMLTISNFTSGWAQGSARSDGPPKSMVIKAEDPRGRRRKNREQLRENEGGKDCGYLISGRSRRNVLSWHKHFACGVCTQLWSHTYCQQHAVGHYCACKWGTFYEPSVCTLRKSVSPVSYRSV